MCLTSWNWPEGAGQRNLLNGFEVRGSTCSSKFVEEASARWWGEQTMGVADNNDLCSLRWGQLHEKSHKGDGGKRQTVGSGSGTKLMFST